MQLYIVVSYVIIDVVMLQSRAQLYSQFLANLFCSCGFVYYICYLVIKTNSPKSTTSHTATSFFLTPKICHNKFGPVLDPSKDIKLGIEGAWQLRFCMPYQTPP